MDEWRIRSYILASIVLSRVGGVEDESSYFLASNPLFCRVHIYICIFGVETEIHMSSMLMTLTKVASQQA
jgi:hypothetical protein